MWQPNTPSAFERALCDLIGEVQSKYWRCVGFSWTQLASGRWNMTVTALDEGTQHTKTATVTVSAIPVSLEQLMQDFTVLVNDAMIYPTSTAGSTTTSTSQLSN